MSGTRRRSIFASRLVNTAGEGQQPRVMEDLRQAILGGDEPPGTPIPIDAVAQFFGVSQIPVREALKVLLGEGLVEHVPHVGYSVAKLTFTEFRELYDVRQALETSALRESVHRATPDDDDRAREVHAAMAGAMSRGDERDYHAQSRSFHRALIAPSGMQRLAHMHEGAWNMTEPARPMSRIEPVERSVFYDDHHRLLMAFTSRDETALIEESQRHFDHLRTAIEAFRHDPDVFRTP